MANDAHLKILKEGVSAWNKWRKENPDMRPELTESNLIGADLSGADLFRGRTSDLGDEVMRPSSFDLNGVPRNPQSVR